MSSAVHPTLYAKGPVAWIEELMGASPRHDLEICRTSATAPGLSGVMRSRFASLGRFLLLLLVVVAAVAVGPADGAPSSAPLRWPDRRFAACGAVDPASGSLYAYGGRADDGITHHADLWALDMDRGARPEWRLARGRRTERATAGAQVRGGVESHRWRARRFRWLGRRHP